MTRRHEEPQFLEKARRLLDSRTLRKARQTLAIDGHFGMDVVPVSHRVIRRTDTIRLASAPAAARAVQPSAPSEPPIDLPLGGEVLSPEAKVEALRELEQRLTAWVHETWPRDGWRKVVFGEGNPAASIMFIGEGPGADEDAQGRPFVGRAGQLLDKQIEAMGLQRPDVYIANIARTRPPGNRVPTPEEAEQWMPWLEQQVQIIRPQVIVTLGATAAKYLLRDPRLAITRQRGQWQTYRGIPLMPTFHPAYLLRSYTVENRRRVWEDLKKVLERLGLPIPGISGSPGAQR